MSSLIAHALAGLRGQTQTDAPPAVTNSAYSPASPYPHKIVHDRIFAAYNEPRLLPALVDLFASGQLAEDVKFCDPYPSCKAGIKGIKHYLINANASLIDSYMIGMPLGSQTTMFEGASGGFWAPSFQMSIRSESQPKSCMVGSAEFVQWNFVLGTDKLQSINIF